MFTKFRFTDSKNKKYTIEKMPLTTEHIYLIRDTKGHYSEIKFDGEKWNNSFLPKYVYDISEIGNLIQEHYDF